MNTIFKTKFVSKCAAQRQKCGTADHMRSKDNGQMCHWARPIEIMDLRRGRAVAVSCHGLMSRARRRVQWCREFARFIRPDAQRPLWGGRIVHHFDPSIARVLPLSPARPDEMTTTAHRSRTKSREWAWRQRRRREWAGKARTWGGSSGWRARWAEIKWRNSIVESSY